MYFAFLVHAFFDASLNKIIFYRIHAPSSQPRNGIYVVITGPPTHSIGGDETRKGRWCLSSSVVVVCRGL